ncbi:MAG: class I SAM-dependent methyltransferase [Bacteroidia bacterium]|nr:class I SAM-dependent methyltransferase [Bacteroidia bacterium]NNF32267.1 methyltransferase domain-containing protein [Flavobacteriaceae bacterium]MBT8276909.1 class I SAM-dependent methyltransferase [Bacteroidia bacterium]NNJ82899.1 methyltransferase domain-containing protein [Flavobacteriaceae bacterium]NNK53774.1 methyltransferase domain-containing protein [Flavobacteriaceae bacterium]
MDDIFGRALLDYYNNKYTEDLITETSISEPDEIPLPYLFRGFDEMPMIEQTALLTSRGAVLDVGCGAGNHSLYLQNKGFEVTAIDESEGAVKVASQRGVNKTLNCSLLDFEGTFDTILLLMNGTGIFSTVEEVPKYLQHFKKLLKPGGQILVDGSDLQYMYDQTEEGAIWVPGDRYYGELEFIISYKGESTAPFPWLYLDERLFEILANENGFDLSIIERGENFDYLARLSVR